MIFLLIIATIKKT